MLPDVDSDKGSKTLCEGCAGFGLGDYIELVVAVGRKPYPTRAEESGGGRVHARLHRIDIAEGGVYSVEQLARGLFLRLGRELVEIECVVPYLCRIVEDSSVRFADDLFEGHVLVTRILYQLVEFVDIGRMVLVMMIVDSLGRYVRLQSLWGIVKFAQRNQRYSKCYHNTEFLVVIMS